MEKKKQRLIIVNEAWLLFKDDKKAFPSGAGKENPTRHDGKPPAGKPLALPSGESDVVVS